MRNLKERKDIIKFALMLNTTNLSPLRSGNLSIRVIENDVEGFLLTPSGIKYETLKPEDIVFLALDEKYDNLKMFNSGLNPSSEWRFHQDVYIKKIQIYPKKSKAMNLAFDVTPAKYVTGLITEKGVCEASEKGLKDLFK